MYSILYIHICIYIFIFQSKLNIQCVTLTPNRNNNVAALNWYSGRVSADRPVLAICYESGKVQLMKNENDEGKKFDWQHLADRSSIAIKFLHNISDPIILDVGMRVTDAKWNHDGSALAICGCLDDFTGNKDVNQIRFFSPKGQHCRTLKVPGSEVTSISWEGKSLRIAMAVDSFIYFANIRPEYVWCYFEKTVVFISNSYNNYATRGQKITFWNTDSNQVGFELVDDFKILKCFY